MRFALQAAARARVARAAGARRENKGQRARAAKRAADELFFCLNELFAFDLPNATVFSAPGTT